MTPEKLEKIRRLAADERGDPATRAIAIAALKRYAAEDWKPPKKEWRDPRHPGLKTSAEYDRYRFMDLGTWKKTANGNNPTYTIVHGGKLYRIVLFKHKRTPTWGWMRVDTINDQTEFSGRFSTLEEARDAAWKALQEV